MKADRMMSVLLLLQARGQVTERELAEHLEVSQRTIHRDLESLSAARIPVYAMRGSQGGWQLEKGWRTQVPGLNESELNALLLAQPRGLGNPRLAAAAQSALNKLMAAMPESMKAQAAHMQQRLHVDPTAWRDTGEDLSMLATVQDAVARDRKLVFDYTRADGQKSSRTVDPLGLVSKGVSWYLVARTTSGMRTFRVSRMRSVAVLAVGFERPSRFDLAAHWQSSTAEFDRQKPSYPALLSLTSEAARRVQAWCKSTPTTQKTDRGRVLLHVEFQTESEARFIVLGLGSEVRVLKPSALREWIQQEASDVAHSGHEPLQN